MVGEESNVSFYWGSLFYWIMRGPQQLYVPSAMEEGPVLQSTVVTSISILLSAPTCSSWHLVLHVCQALLLGLHVRILPGSLPIDHVMLCNSPLPSPYPHFPKHIHMTSWALGIQPLGKGQVCLSLVAPVSILSSAGQSFLNYCLVNFPLRVTEPSLSSHRIQLPLEWRMEE